VIGTSSALFSVGGASAGASLLGSGCAASGVLTAFTPICLGLGAAIGGFGGGELGELVGEAITSEENPLTIENQAEGWTSLIFPSFG
jgi:hypothetical protein